jgi:osmoprotectant transport system permease protein
MKYWFTTILIFFIQALSAQPIRVGAKHFTEGYITSEIIAQLLESNGFQVERHFNLGGTMVCFTALRENQIDVYPEYTGTLSFEVIKTGTALEFESLNRTLYERFRLQLSRPYGFNNTYALVIMKTLGEKYGIETVSDLQKHPAIKMGLSYEFIKREDGWGKLAIAYKLPQQPVALEHGLAYQALQQDKIELTDAYSTDGEIQRFDLLVLKDDKQFFPQYLATSFYRDDLNEHAKKVLEKLQGTITESEMQAMNASVLYKHQTYAEVATAFLTDRRLLGPNTSSSVSPTKELLKKIGVHLQLTFSALLLAILIALPIGIVLHWYPKASAGVLYIAGLLQTIPSIALLALLIPLTGIGIMPAITALFLYALLPILRNTVTGLQAVDPVLKKVADGMGMSKIQKMKWLEFPLALPTIVAGIRTAAVINIGTATLAAFIGAGGLGEYIVTGLALNDTAMILHGAVPAALLAIVVELIFGLLQRYIVPRYLREGY